MKKSTSISIKSAGNITHIEPSRREDLHRAIWQQEVVDFIMPLSAEELKLIAAYTDLVCRGYKGKPKPESSEVIQFPSK